MKKDVTTEPSAPDTAGAPLATLRLTYEDFRAFLRELAPHISMGGMFVPAEEPLEPGTRCRLAIDLEDGFPLIEGRGEVVWARESAQADDRPAGMGLRFRELEEPSRDLVYAIVEQRLQESLAGEEGIEAGIAGESLELEDLLRSAAERRHRSEQQSGPETESEPETPAQALSGAVERRASSDPPPEEDAPPQAPWEAPGPEVTEAEAIRHFRLDPLPEDDEAPAPLDRPQVVMPEEPLSLEEPPLEAPAQLELAEESSALALRYEAEPESLELPEPASEVEEENALAQTVVAPRPRTPVIPADLEPLLGLSRGRGEEPLPTGLLREPPELPFRPAPPPEPDELTAGAELRPRRRRSRSRKLPWPRVALLAFLLLAAALWYFREPLIALLPSAVEEPPVAEVPADSADQAGPADTAESADPAPAPEPVETSPLPSPPPPPPPPAPSAPAPEVSSGPALSALQEISWRNLGDAVEVTLRFDGAVVADDIRRSRLTSGQVRELLRIRGVDRPYRQGPEEVATGGLQRIRTGHHQKAGGPELHVVLDLSGPEVEVGPLQIEGRVVRIPVASPARLP